MSDATWKQILVAAQVIGKVIVAGFGEPLMDPKCLSHIQDLDDLGVWTSISTNGILLSPRTSERLASLKHLFHINVSIDSPDPATYREMRGGEVGKALRGLSNLMSAIDDPERITVSSVLMKGNLASLAAFPPILSRLRVRKYVLQSQVDLNPEGQHEHLFELCDAELRVSHLRTACHRVGVQFDFTLPDRLNLELRDLPMAQRQYWDGGNPSERESRKCTIPWEIPFIDKDGLVYPCCYSSALHADIVGDLGKTSLVAIWRSEAFHEFRQRLVDGDLPDSCRACSAVGAGEHPFHRYSAQILFEESQLRDHRQMRLVVQNQGTCIWDRNTPVRIGTALPRDRQSAYYDPTWISSNRLVSFTEEKVPPGETATFRFRLKPSFTVPSESFQLVVEGIAWLPGTTFELPSSEAQGTRIVALTYRVSIKTKLLLHRLLWRIRRTRRAIIAYFDDVRKAHNSWGA